MCYSFRGLLLAVIAALLVEQSFASPGRLSLSNIKSRFRKSTDQATSPSSTVDIQSRSLYIPGTDCPSDYTQRNGGCFLIGAQYTLESANGLITIYPTGPDGKPQPVTAHHAIFTVHGTTPDGTRVPVPGMPVEIVPKKTDQHVYVVDSTSGEIKLETVKARSRLRAISNAQGRVTFSFPITKDQDVAVQKIRVRGDFMGKREWRSFYPDTAAMTALGKVSAEQLRSAKPDLPADVAEETSERLRILVGIPAVDDHRAYVDEAKQSIELTPADEDPALSKRVVPNPPADELIKEDWYDIKKESIQTVRIVRDGTKSIVKAVVKTAKKVWELVVNSVYFALEIAVSLLYLVGLTVKTVIDAVKYVVRWDYVVYTQIAFLNGLQHLRETSFNYLEDKREKVLERFNKHKGTFKEKIGAITNTLKRDPEVGESVQQTVQALDSTQQGGVTEYTFVTDLIVTNGDKLEVTSVSQQSIESLHVQLQTIEKELQSPAFEGQHAELAQQAADLRKDIKEKGVTKNYLLASLAFLKAMFTFNGAMSIWMIQAIMELFWIIMMMPIKVPVVNHLYRYIINNGYFDMSLMSFVTLGPAIAYTYGYMLTHLGRPPFPRVPSWQTPLPPRDLPPSPGDTPATDTELEQEQPQPQDLTAPPRASRVPPTSEQQKQQPESTQGRVQKQPSMSTDIVVRKRGNLTRRFLGGLKKFLVAFLSAALILAFAEVFLFAFYGFLVFAATMPVSLLFLTVMAVLIYREDP
ncbi:hypothetical protein HK102_001807 [Quaeritorhiza haematococci]|nr:hypothetical protein HK102_001807 [Quaeritorhiza haematococci]